MFPIQGRGSACTPIFLERRMHKISLVLAVAFCVAAGCESTNPFNINFHDLNVNLGACCSSQQGNCNCQTTSNPSSQPSGGNVPTVSGHCVDDFGDHTIVVVDVNPTVNAGNQPLPQPTTKPATSVQA